MTRVLGAAVRGVLFVIALLAPAASAAQLGPDAPLATPHGFVGRMTVSPERRPPGTPVRVTAEGLPADTDFQLVWRTVKGRWKVAQAEYHGREYTPAAFEIATVRTDAAGRLAATFTVPEDFGFLHDVALQQGERLFIQAGFSVDMSVTLSPQCGPVGTPIKVEVKGIGWRPLESSWMLLYDNNFTGWISAVTTSGSAHLPFPPADGPACICSRYCTANSPFPTAICSRARKASGRGSRCASTSPRVRRYSRRQLRSKRSRACKGCRRRARSRWRRPSPVSASRWR